MVMTVISQAIYFTCSTYGGSNVCRVFALYRKKYTERRRVLIINCYFSVIRVSLIEIFFVNTPTKYASSASHG